MTNPLNPKLYQALKRRFNDVRIANEGVPYISAENSGQSGEYYVVNCPSCGDQRFRLWINHMYGVRGENGDDHLNMCYCYNENCFNDHQKRLQLHDMIFPFGYRRRQSLGQIRSVRGPQQQANRARTIQLPSTVPLDTPSSIRGTDYLRSRGFDIHELSNSWQIQYCVNCRSSSPQIYDRIVIPIYEYRQEELTGQCNVNLAGWQARTVDSYNSQCKYLFMSGFRKQQVLYGLPQATQSAGPLVVVEGPTDVWRLGSNAVATFGKTISSQQIALLIRYFADRPIIVIFDRDARAESERAVCSIQRERENWGIRSPVLNLQLPENVNDVAECSREWIWHWIWQSAPACFYPTNQELNSVPGGAQRSAESTELSVDSHEGDGGGWEIEL